MSTTTLTSELEAINTMLDAIGESPVSSLDISGLVDVAKAQALLSEISREVQSIGWNFNTETEYPLALDETGGIPIPLNFLAADVSRLLPQMDVVQRGTKLYDKRNHTYTFAQSITADVTILLPWEELPQVARHYIMIRASRIYQTRTLGSDTLHRFSAEQEKDAYEALSLAEGESGDYNMLSGSWSVARILER